jgi:hypothetical protein
MKLFTKCDKTNPSHYRSCLHICDKFSDFYIGEFLKIAKIKKNPEFTVPLALDQKKKGRKYTGIPSISTRTYIRQRLLILIAF